MFEVPGFRTGVYLTILQLAHTRSLLPAKGCSPTLYSGFFRGPKRAYRYRYLDASCPSLLPRRLYLLYLPSPVAGSPRAPLVPLLLWGRACGRWRARKCSERQIRLGWGQKRRFLEQITTFCRVVGRGTWILIICSNQEEIRANSLAIFYFRTGYRYIQTAEKQENE